MKSVIIAMVLTTGAFTGCQNSDKAHDKNANAPAEEHRSDEEVATDVLAGMLQCAETDDWDNYVDLYYGEQNKFRSPADRNALVKRFKEDWGKSVVLVLTQAATLPVRIEDERAMFVKDDVLIFILYRDENANWKFHL